MAYAQKYCLVAFVEPQKVGTEFHMSEWPLHITLADVFAVDRIGSNLDRRLQELLSSQNPIDVTAQDETTLGTTPVVLIEKSDELLSLHAHLVDTLTSCNAMFNTPEFTYEGFSPHCTIQQSSRLQTGDTFTIYEICLVDMFAGSDWEQRKVLSNFRLL